MKNGKYQNDYRVFGSKFIAALLALVLMMTCIVSGTVAWLTDTTDEVENTFTVGNINIDLDESDDLDLKMIPGWTIDKDPIVTVKAGSEDCWVFIKVDEVGEATIGDTTYGFNDFITYAIDKNWTPLTDTNNDGKAEDGVYYCYAKDVDADRPIKVLGYYDSEGNFVNNKVLVKDTVTKEMMDALLKKGTDGKVILDKDGNPTYDTGKLPKLTFTAYAVQYYSSNDTPFEPADAWAQVAP